MHPNPSLLVAGLVAGTLIAAAASAQDEAPQEPQVYEGKDRSGNALRVSVVEKTIGYSDPAMNPDSLQPSPDGQGVTYMVMAGNGLAVVQDGVQGEPFDAIHPDSLTYGTDGHRFGYAAMRNEVSYVVLDGIEYEGLLNDAGILFSPDGKRAGFVVTKANTEKQLAIIDGESGKEYGGISDGGVLFSLDSQHYAYVVEESGTRCVVRDGEEGPLFEDVLGLWFSPNSKHFAYIARQGDKWIPFYDGDPVGRFRKVAQQGFAFPTDNGDHYALAVVGDEPGCKVLVDGEEVGSFDSMVHLMSFSPDGSRIACLVGKKDKNFLFLDGQEYSDFDAYLTLTFSPDGKRYAYTARRGEKIVAVIDGEEGSEFDLIEEPGILFSVDSSRVVYMGTRESESVAVIDGEGSTPFRRPGKRPMGFISGSNHVMYSLRRKGHEVLVVDGEEGPPLLTIRNITSTPDGKRFAYAGQGDDQLWSVVVDGKEYAKYPYIAKGTVTLSPDGKHVAYGAGAENKNFLVVDKKEVRRFDFLVPGTVAFSPDSQHVLCVAATADQRYIVVDDVLLKGDWDGFLGRSTFVFENDKKFTIRGSKLGRLVRIEAEILD
jgi:WD40 repeat protein